MAPLETNFAPLRTTFYCIFQLISQLSGPNFLTEFFGVDLFGENTLNQTILEIKMSLRINSQHFPLFCTLSYLFILCTAIFCPLLNQYRICTSNKNGSSFRFLLQIATKHRNTGHWINLALCWADHIFCLGLLGDNTLKPSFCEQKVGLGLFNGSAS